MKLIHKLYTAAGAALILIFVLGTMGIITHKEVLNVRATNYEKDILSRELIIYWFICNYLFLLLILILVEYLTVINKNDTTHSDVSLEMREIKVIFGFNQIFFKRRL
jgi:hypothetical protein